MTPRRVLESSRIGGVLRIDAPAAIPDDRGSFSTAFAPEGFAGVLDPLLPLSQVAVSSSLKRGTLRGMHWQADPAPQAKALSCLRGRVWDVLVDVRRDSPTYGRWDSFVLTPGSGMSIYIPPGIAHGWMSLEDETELLYLLWGRRDPALERGLRWDDPDLGIRWPEEPTLLSARDRGWPAFASL